MIRPSDRTDLFVDQQVLFESNKLQKIEFVHTGY